MESWVGLDTVLTTPCQPEGCRAGAGREAGGEDAHTGLLVLSGGDMEEMHAQRRERVRGQGAFLVTDSGDT